MYIDTHTPPKKKKVIIEGDEIKTPRMRSPCSGPTKNKLITAKGSAHTFEHTLRCRQNL